tara:strand:- start:772 stop:1611 length:840 start_codon:yes stop_codon:yes gene_type:complete
MRKFKIILFGSTGMLGSQMLRHLSKNKKFKIFEMNRKKKAKSIKININNQEEIINRIKYIKPDYLINCIGWIKQKNINPNKAYLVNTQFPIFLSNLSLILNYKFIHISTDCVFSGSKGAYKDNDYKDAKDLYGLSKNFGEVKNLNTCTLRTSIIGFEITRKKFGLLEWFLSQKHKVKGYNKVYFSGLTTLEMSKVIEKYLSNKKIYNQVLNVSSEYISKYTLLKIIKIIFKKDIELVKSPKIKLNRTLNSEKFRIITGYKCPSWKKMISELYLSYKNNK